MSTSSGSSSSPPPASTTNGITPQSRPTTLHFHPPNHLPISVSAHIDGIPVAGDIVAAAIEGNVPDYQDWDVAMVAQNPLYGFDLTLPDNPNAARRRLVYELSEKLRVQSNTIKSMKKSFSQELEKKKNLYESTIKVMNIQHQRETPGCVAVELDAMRTRYERHFIVRLRHVKQELESAKMIATLATLDGIMKGLNGVLFPKAPPSGPNEIALRAKCDQYNLTCIDDLVKSDPRDRTEDENEVIKSLLQQLPSEFRDLAREVYNVLASSRRKIKTAIIQYPQISQAHALKRIYDSDLHDKFTEIGRWFILSCPRTDESEIVFGSEDSSGVERLESEVREVEEEIRRLKQLDPPASV